MRPWIRHALPLVWTFVFLVPAGYAAAYLVAGLYDVPLDEASFRFERPWGALLFVAPLLVLAAHYVHRWQRPRLQVSRGMTLASIAPGWRVWLDGSVTGARVVAATLLVFALMGPQSIHAKDRTEVEGIDIVLVLDMSRSMEA
ncbi:MAG: hypothetical protein H6698_09945, partial [Myxococcales bacterium]|nr:hypothetical protein [Myxococcales bacterium]